MEFFLLVVLVFLLSFYVQIHSFTVPWVHSIDPPALQRLLVVLCPGYLDFLGCFPPPAFPVCKQQGCCRGVQASCTPKKSVCPQNEEGALLFQVLSQHQTLPDHRTPCSGWIRNNIPNCFCFVGRFWGCSATCCHRRVLLGTPLALWATTETLGTCWGDTPGRNPCLCLHPALRIATELLEKIKLSKKKPPREKGSVGSKGWSEMRPQGWAGPLGHRVVPTLSQHSRWTQHQLLFPSGQSDMVSRFLLCVCPLGLWPVLSQIITAPCWPCENPGFPPMFVC